ncbi:MAG TPA: methyltransferase domain-containing protein [Anaerolineaceae bacterium]|nr:methyltransferase domain-containing protein [Anaerolineaceae bacterium]HPN52228.1 methyltransferase domain-containing protein [Anaerolineaceae bacterium]
MTQQTPSSPPVCSYEGSDYQRTFWEQGGRAYEDAAEEIALRRLLPTQGHLMLELGAGAGRNTPRYAGYERVVLVDYSRTQLEQARARLGSSSKHVYVCADIYHLPFTAGLFDGATMIRTLHHMAEPRLALEQVRRTMQQGGIFILEFANKQNLKAIARYFLRRQRWSPFSPEPVEYVPLNYDFHPATVKTWLSLVGFAVERRLTVSHFRIGFLKRLLPLKLLVGMDSLAQLTGDWWQLSPSVFTRARAAGEPAAQPAPDAFFNCPACGVDLPEEEHDLVCPGCGRIWPCRDGIYDFRLEPPTAAE